MKIWVLVLLAYLFSPPLFAQENIKIEAHPDTAIYNASRELALAEKAGDLPKIYFLSRKVGDLYKNQTHYDQAIAYYKKGLALAKQKQNAFWIITFDLNIGVALESGSKFIESQQYNFQALSVSESAKDHPFQALVYDNIASVFLNENQIPKAREYVQKALAVLKPGDTTMGNTKALEAMGVIQIQIRTPGDTVHRDSARVFFSRALDLYTVIKDSVGQATMYEQLAATYSGTYADELKSLQYCLKAKAILDHVSPMSTTALYNMCNIASAYWNVSRLGPGSSRNAYAVQAIRYYKGALALSRKVSNSIAALFALDNLAMAEATLGKSNDAYKDMRQYNTLHDSVYSRQNAEAIASIEHRHDLELRDKQIALNQLEITSKKRQTLFLSAGLFLLLCIALLVYIQSINRRKTNIQLQGLNQQLASANKINTQFFSILQHDLRRPIAGIISLLRFQKNNPALGERALQSAENLLESMEDLLLWSKSQMENFKPQFREVAITDLFGYLKNAFPVGEVQFQQPSGEMTLHTDEHFMRTILLNLTNNAVHALSDTPSPLIEWKAWQDETNNYVSISDNGPGATEEQLRPLYDDTIPIGIRNGLGLHIVRDMARAIQCTIVVNTQRVKGVEIRLVVRRQSGV